MNDIGHGDIESYLRTLVSEGFAKPFNAAGGGSEQSDEAYRTGPPPAADQTDCGKKKR